MFEIVWNKPYDALKTSVFLFFKIFIIEFYCIRDEMPLSYKWEASENEKILEESVIIFFSRILDICT